MSKLGHFTGVEGLISWAIKKIKGNKQERSVLPVRWRKLSRRERRKAWLTAIPRALRRQRRWAVLGSRQWLGRLGNTVETLGLTQMGPTKGDRSYGVWQSFDALEPRTLLSGSIAGTVYNDINANGAKGSTEPGLVASTVYLDANNNSQLDSGEVSMTTGSDGTFQFDGLTAGSYTVREVLPSGGWNQTSPASNAARSATVTDGQTTAGVDFGARFVQIIDDGDAGYSNTGSWIFYGAGYQSDERYIATGNGSAVAYWTFSGLEPGLYQVAATFPVYSNQPTNAGYQMTDVDESRSLGTAYVNQAISPASSSQPAGGFAENGTNWAYLGSAVTLGGNTLQVALSNNANANYMAADAVRLVRVGDLPAAPVPVVQASITGTSLVDDQSSISFGSTPMNIGASKTLTVTNAGLADLILGDPSVPAGFSVTTALNTHTVTPGSSATFVITMGSGGSGNAVPGTYSGAVSLTTNDAGHATFDFIVSGTVLTIAVIDDGEPGYSTTGTWTPYPTGYKGDEQYVQASGTSTATASWTFTGVTPGQYRVSATWPSYSNQPVDAPFTINDTTRGLTLAQVRVNQGVTPSDLNDLGAWWKDLAVVSVSDAGGSTLVVTLSNDASPVYMAADAVRLERIGDVTDPAAPILRINDGKADVVAGGTDDYGTTTLGVNVPKTFTVSNTGFADLTLGQLTTPAGYTLVSAPGSSTLAPGASTTFVLALNGSTPGSYTGDVTLDSNAGSVTFALSGTVATAAIIDDGDPGYSETGTWIGYAAGFRGDERYVATGTGSATANWTFSNLSAGVYRVSATWPSYSNQSTNAVYVMTDVDSARVAGSAAVNQKLAPVGFTDLGGTWQDLSASLAVTGTSLAVSLSNLANGSFMAADAIRVERLGDLPTTATSAVQILDGIAPLVSGGTLDYGSVALTSTVTRTFTIRNTGLADLHLGQITVPSGFTLTTPPGSSVLSPGGTTTFALRLDGTTPGTLSQSLTVASDANNTPSFALILTAIVSPARVIDDGDAGYSTTGTWLPYGVGFHGDENYAQTTTGGTPTATATWTFDNLPTGIYKVSATWPAFNNQPTNAPYTISDGSQTLATASVDQSHAPGYVNGTVSFTDLGGTWQDLATGLNVAASGGSLVVTLGNNANATYMAADAIRIERVGNLESEAPPVPTIIGLPANGTARVGQPISLAAAPGEGSAGTISYEWIVTEESDAPSYGFAPGALWMLRVEGPTLDFTPTVRGLYNITLTAFKDGGTNGASTEVTPIQIIAPPDIAIAGVPEADINGFQGSEGDDISLDAEITNDYGQGGFTFHWVVTTGGATVFESTESTLDFFPEQDGIYHVELTVTNSFNEFTSTTTDLSIADTSPFLWIWGDSTQSAYENQPFVIDLYSYDPGQDTVTKWTIDWGDKSTPTVVTGTAIDQPVEHTYTDGPSDFTVSATAENNDGVFDAEPLLVHVNNVAPTADFTVTGSPTEGLPPSETPSDIPAGTPATFNFENQADDTADTSAGFTYRYDFGDDSPIVDSSSAAQDHYYKASGTYYVYGTITDRDGDSSIYEQIVVVADVEPTLIVTGNSMVDEGFGYELSLTWRDVPTDNIKKWTINWGDGRTSTVPTNWLDTDTSHPRPVTTLVHTYLDGTNQSSHIVITAKDDEGSYTKSKDITVYNIAPTASFTGVADTILVSGTTYYDILQGSDFNALLGTTDPGSEPTFTWTIDWGDGSGGAPISGNPTFTSHAYNAPGDYTIHARVNDGTDDSQDVVAHVRVKQADFNAPTAANISASDIWGQTISIPLAANVVPAVGRSLGYFSITAEPSHGTATIDPTTGVISYTGDVGYVGSDSVGYSVYDTAWESASAQVNISVRGNVPPVAQSFELELPIAIRTGPGGRLVPVSNDTFAVDILSHCYSGEGYPLKITQLGPSPVNMNLWTGNISGDGLSATLTLGITALNTWRFYYQIEDDHGQTAYAFFYIHQTGNAPTLLPPPTTLAPGESLTPYDPYGQWANGGGQLTIANVGVGTLSVSYSGMIVNLSSQSGTDFSVAVSGDPTLATSVNWSGSANSLSITAPNGVGSINLSAASNVVNGIHLAGDVTVVAGGSVGAVNGADVSVTAGGNVGTISATNISVHAGGSIAGLQADESISAVYAGGAINGSITAGTAIGSIYSGGNLSAAIHAGTTIEDIHTNRDWNSSVVTAVSLGKLTVDRDINAAMVFTTSSITDSAVSISIGRDVKSSVTANHELAVYAGRDLSGKLESTGDQITAASAGRDFTGDLKAATMIGPIFTGNSLSNNLTPAGGPIGPIAIRTSAAAPGSATALVAGFDSIQLLWEDQAAHDDGYQIEYTYRSYIDPNDHLVYPDWSYVAADGTSTTSGPETSSDLLINGQNAPVNFVLGKKYYFRVRLSGDGNASAGIPAYSYWSNVATATIDPVNLTIDSNNDGLIDVSDDAVESSSAQLIFASSSDSDTDGSPDWFDGFDADHSAAYNSDDAGPTTGFYDVHISIPSFISMSTGMIQFDYSGPSALAANSTGMLLWNVHPGGTITNETDADRLAIKDESQWIKPGQAYPISMFKWDGDPTNDVGVKMQLADASSTAPKDLTVKTWNPSQTPGTDSAKVAPVDVKILIGASDPDDTSTADDWVGADGDVILNYLIVKGPASTTLDFVPDWGTDVGSLGTIQLRTITGVPFDLTHHLTVTTDAQGAGSVPFLIVGQHVSSSTEDLEVNVSRTRNGPIVAFETITVLRANMPSDTGGLNNVPLNPVVVNKDAWKNLGNLFGVQNTRDSSEVDRLTYSNGLTFGKGFVEPDTRLSKKIAPSLIDALWGRQLFDAAGAPVGGLLTSDQNASPLHVRPANTDLTEEFAVVPTPPLPPHNEFGPVSYTTAFRMRDEDIALFSVVEGQAVVPPKAGADRAEYFFGHPTATANILKTALNGDTLAANHVAEFTSWVRQQQTVQIKLHLLEGVLGSTTLAATSGITAGQVETVMEEVAKLWSQAGITPNIELASGGLNIVTDHVTGTNTFLILRSDDEGAGLITFSPPTASLSPANIGFINVYFVQHFARPDPNHPGKWDDDFGVTIYPAHAGKPGIIIGTLTPQYFKGNPVQNARYFDQIAKTIGHELAHYLIDNNAESFDPIALRADGTITTDRIRFLDYTYIKDMRTAMGKKVGQVWW